MRIFKLRIVRIGKLLIKLSFLIFFLFIFYKMLVKSYEILKKNVPRSRLVLEYRLVHLDLKGAPPRLEYLKTVLPVLKEAGANGLLVEYEDMFPYEGRIRNLSARNCYDKEKLHSFLKLATDSGFEIIPLIQTFGHMEMALKLQEFKHLREEHESPDSICPNRIGSSELILEMVTQIMDFHSNTLKIRWLHIGCDEVFHINSCLECQTRKLTNIEIFQNHIFSLSEKISLKYPDLKLIIWDDMLRGIPPKTMQNIKFGDNIELMVWVYGPVIQTVIPYHTMYKYIKTFEHIWIASAFKGANRESSVFPDLRNRYVNNLAWLDYANSFEIIKNRKSELYTFKGIALTGWSRYNHFAPLCELFPNSLPSVVLNLALIEEFTKNYSQDCMNCYVLHDNVYHTLMTHMNCDELKNTPIDIITYQHIDELEMILGNCKFDGSKLYKTLMSLHEIKLSTIMSYLNKQFKDSSVLDSYLSANSLSSIDISVVSGFSVGDRAKVLKSFIIKLREVLGGYYDVYTIEEYVKIKTDPLVDMLRNLTVERNDKIEKVWKRGPIALN